MNHFKVVSREVSERRIENIVVPARVVHAAYVHVRAIIRDDQTILLHGAKDFLQVRVAGSVRHIDIRLQAQARAHGQRTQRRTGAMGSRIDVTIGRPHRDTQCVANFCDGRIVNLIVTNETRKDRQSGGIRGRPGIRPAIVGIHVEERAGAREPFSLSGIVEDVVQLVEMISILIDDQ